MSGKRITLFKLLGFAVHVDLSWVILALLVTWSLAVGLFPYALPDLSPFAYWLMGAVGAAGLFFSIVFHELFHSLVARRFGLPMKPVGRVERSETRQFCSDIVKLQRNHAI